MKVLEAKASMQDLTFAKEYRGSGSYRPGTCIPALELTRYTNNAPPEGSVVLLCVYDTTLLTVASLRNLECGYGNMAVPKCHCMSN